MSRTTDNGSVFPDCRAPVPCGPDPKELEMISRGVNPYCEEEMGENYVPEGVDESRRALIGVSLRERYEILLESTRGISMDPLEDNSKKSRILMDLFPKKYGPGARRDLSGCSSLFADKMYKTACAEARSFLGFSSDREA